MPACCAARSSSSVSYAAQSRKVRRAAGYSGQATATRSRRLMREDMLRHCMATARSCEHVAWQAPTPPLGSNMYARWVGRLCHRPPVIGPVRGSNHTCCMHDRMHGLAPSRRGNTAWQALAPPLASNIPTRWVERLWCPLRSLAHSAGVHSRLLHAVTHAWPCT